MLPDKSDSSSSSSEDKRKKVAKIEAERRKLFLDVPSTSSGITSNGKGVLFRIHHKVDDSDDDEFSDGPMVATATTTAATTMHSPHGLRGSFDTGDDLHLFNTNSYMNEPYLMSSPSNNSRFSSSFHDDDEDTLTSVAASDNDDSDTKTAEATPKKENGDGAVDSGTASASSSMLKVATEGSRLKNGGGVDSKLLLDKLNHVKSNYCKKFEDSDSD